jgi:hypothetical protein
MPCVRTLEPSLLLKPPKGHITTLLSAYIETAPALHTEMWSFAIKIKDTRCFWGCSTRDRREVAFGQLDIVYMTAAGGWYAYDDGYGR